MNTRRVLEHYPNVAIAIVPASVLVALVSELFVSVAPADPASSASLPTASSTTQAPPSSELELPESADITYEKSDYGVQDAATYFFDLLNYEIIYQDSADFTPIVTGTCKAEQCWKTFREQEDLRTGPEDMQTGGYYFLHTDYIVRFDGNSAYLMGELTLSERSLLRPDQENIIVEEQNLGEITMGLEYTDNGWKVSAIALESLPSKAPLS
ncbi:hypothetical protein [Glutamicibacter sp. NPDC090743]|uniref:hypothetical protein n=1 Tax=Glutamicibacter sp. NPDC090743 TaxID=3364001 RepID=UPI0037F98BFF